MAILFLLLCCALTRLVAVRRLKNLLPSSILDVIIRQWIYCYGRMSMIITDQGPGFVGESWNVFLGSWNYRKIMTATHSARSNGIAERQVS